MSDRFKITDPRKTKLKKRGVKSKRILKSKLPKTSLSSATERHLDTIRASDGTKVNIHPSDTIRDPSGRALFEPLPANALHFQNRGNVSF